MALMAVAGCSTYQSDGVAIDGAIPRTLPQPPGYLMPVDPPDPDPDLHVEIAAQKNRAALVQANARLKRARAWYDCTRRQYSENNVNPKTCGGG